MDWNAVGAAAGIASVVIAVYELRLRNRGKKVKRLESRLERQRDDLDSLDRRTKALYRLYRDLDTRLQETSRRGGQRWYDPG